MRKLHFLKKYIVFFSLIFWTSLSFAQSIEVDCQSNNSGSTYCTSYSPNATTDSAVLAGYGKIGKVKLRNIENVPVVIQTLPNTDNMTLYGEIDNRGRAQDVTVDVQGKYDISSAPLYMSVAPNSGSAFIVADSINNLTVSVNGYAGKNGRNLSKLCGDRALTALSASTIETCQAQVLAGKLTGYFQNPNCDIDIIDINQQVASKVSSNNGVCSNDDILKTMTDKAPPSFCPVDHFYLKDRDGGVPPTLKSRISTGDLSEFLANIDYEAPVRLRYMNKCIKESVYRQCTISGNVTVSAPLLSYANTAGSTPSVQAVVGQPLSISPQVISYDVPVTNCHVAVGSLNSNKFPSDLTIDPSTCEITGTPQSRLNSTTFSIVAENAAGTSPVALITLSIIDPTIENAHPVNYVATIGSTDTPSSSVISVYKQYNEVTATCDQKFDDAKSNNEVPKKEKCYLDQPGPVDCLKVVETKTEIRDVINYYGAPSLSYGTPILTFTQGQTISAGAGTAISPTFLASANSGTPISGCMAVTDPDSFTGSLPEGLSVDSNCVISGTLPNLEISMRSFSIVASDASGVSKPANIMISVMPGPTIATLSYPPGTQYAVTNQPIVIRPTLNLNQGAGPITSCTLRPDSENNDIFPSSLLIDQSTCTISGTPTAEMLPTFFTIIAQNSDGTSNSARVSIAVSNTPISPTFSSGQNSSGTCPYASDGEIFEKYTQDHVLEPYTPEITISGEYEELDCMYGNCPGVTDTYTFSQDSSVNFTIEPGETGSFGGRADIFAYDISSTNLSFANGSNGSNGFVDIAVPSIPKYCAKVVDARGLNSNANDVTQPKLPLVNFHKSIFSPMSYTLPTTIPGTAFPQRTQDQAIGIFKKVDSSVRQFIINEFIEPRFQ